MIPEFPLPPPDVDFYKSKLFQLKPIFGTAITSIPQLMSSSSEDLLMPVVQNPMNLLRPLKLAKIQKQTASRKSEAAPKTAFSINNLKSTLLGTLPILHGLQ